MNPGIGILRIGLWALIACFVLALVYFAIVPSWGILASVLPDVLIKGVVLGFMFALIALGYTMVYGVLQLINFAHSEVFATGAVVGFQVFAFMQNIAMNGYLKLFVAIVLAMAISGALNVLIERVAYRPLRGAKNRLVPLISAIGVSFFLQDALRLLAGLINKQFNLVYSVPDELNNGFKLTETLFIPYKEVVIVGLTLVALGGLYHLVNRTRTGKAIRAVAQDRHTAALMGIDADRMVTLTFLIGGALGGMAGVMWGLEFGKVTAYEGIIPGIKAFTAAVLGGIGSIPGAVLGGLVLGVVESFLGVVPSIVGSQLPEGNPFKWLQSLTFEYKDIGAFIVLIVILIFKPSGLLGKAVTEKV
ncbi:MAG: branched-chain amino acid ABC transporter permease [Deinococcaceae bacterium]